MVFKYPPKYPISTISTCEGFRTFFQGQRVMAEGDFHPINIASLTDDDDDELVLNVLRCHLTY